ncbi:MAG: hypothetical protein ABL927_02310 [Bdellovibrionales bacterium]
MKRLEKGPDIFEYTRRPVGNPAQLTTIHRIHPLACWQAFYERTHRTACKTSQIKKEKAPAFLG